MNFIINRKTFISMFFIGLSLLGYISWRNLKMELTPNAELPYLYVQVNSKMEVDPTYMESQAIIPLEGAVGTMEGIESLTSEAQARRGSIGIELNSSIDSKYAYLKLIEKVNEVKGTLPEEFSVKVVKVDLTQMSNQFMELQVRGSGGVDRVRNVADQKIVPDLENIDGIAGVTVYGGKAKSIEVRLDLDACEAYGLTPGNIRQQISGGFKSRAYAGKVNGIGKEYFVHVTAEYTNIAQLENLVVADGPVLLKDVAEIYFGVKEETSYSRVNGKDAVSIRLVNDTQINQIEVAHKTLEVIDHLNQKLASQDIEISVQSNSAETMEANVDQILELALTGALLAVFVLWIFLKNFSLVSIIALSIPISVYSAFNFFFAAEISINSLTLVGMALAIGMLLDNSVVVLENIYRLRSRGVATGQAVIRGTQEVWRSIVAATLTTITVFLPFIFSENFLLKLFGKNVGVSIISTLLVSLVVALLLVPMLSHFIMMRKQDDHRHFNVVDSRNMLVQLYVMILKTTLRKPVQTILSVVVLFFITIFVSLSVSTNAQQEVDVDQFRIFVTMPSGSTLETTDKMVAEIENRIENLKEKKDVLSRIEEEEATITVSLQEDYYENFERSLAQIKSDVEGKVKNISGAEITLEESGSSGSNQGRGRGGRKGGSSAFMRMMGIGSNTEQIVIKGQDFELMKNVAEDLQYFLEEMDGMKRVNVSFSDNRPEVHLVFEPLLMTEYNIRLQNVSQELNSFSGDINTNVPFKQENEEYDIILREKGRDEKKPKRSMEDLKNLQISSNAGGIYDLQDFSDISFSTGYGKITRVNQEKQIEINYRFDNDAQDSKTLLEAYRMEVDEIVANYNLPSGVAIEVIHEEDIWGDFKFLIYAALILIFMILASVFESFTTPFVLMFSIPLAAIGSFVALIFTGNSLFNTNTLTGFLILLGIVVNNGIILIDYAGILRKRGYRRERALLTAGMSRVRPILITAITTIVAMIPLALGNQEYVGAIGAPFAITVIGGLSVSTLFTLVFIPTMYSGLESAIEWFNSLSLKLRIAQGVIWAAGMVLIYYRVYTFMWQLVDVVALTMLVPGIVWFAKTSLRKASETVIDSKEPIQINVQSIVKVYDRQPRFSREWDGNRRIRERAGNVKYYQSWKEFDDFLWQIPLLGFLIYFTFFYLNSGFWMFVFAHAIYFLALTLWKPVEEYLSISAKRNGNTGRISKWGYNLLFWGMPIAFLTGFYFSWNNIGAVITIGLIWYMLLFIHITALMLHRENVNTERLQGKFRVIRRFFFRLVEQIPVVGRKREPFKALRGVSIDIGTGMIGLLGPNGAGKTTLMRVICGIYEQSYGKVWINGIDTQEKREELQGLIGYLPQEFGTYENMSAFDFLDYQATLKGLTDNDERGDRVEYVLNAVHLWDRRDELIGGFSGGMKQRIGIAHILLNLPRILVVDEPTAGLDPRERIRFRNLLVELSRERVVIFSTHVIEDISSSCNQVAVINKGDVRYTGHPNDMVKLAHGLVWQFSIPAREFDALPGKDRIVNHMRNGENIKVRIISAEKPAPDAEMVDPVLEEAYLCLLKGISREMNEEAKLKT